MRSLLSFDNSIHVGATGIALFIAGVLLLGLLTIPAQTEARTPPSGSYSYYPYAYGGTPVPGIPNTGLAGVGADAPLAGSDGRSISLPILGASALIALGAASVGASMWLTRPSRRRI